MSKNRTEEFNRDELGTEAKASDSHELERIGQLMTSERPYPSPAIRSGLRARLSELEAGKSRWQPRRPRAVASVYAGGGVGLLALAAVGLAGAGPLSF